MKYGQKVIYNNETRTIYDIYPNDMASLCLIDEDDFEYKDVEEDYLIPIKELKPKKMETLTQTLTPQEKKELFVTELENRIIKQLGDKLYTRFETCYRAPAFGWSVEEHTYMPMVASRLREKGYSVSSNVSFEVTDWTIAV